MLTNIFLSLAEVILALTLFIYVFNISLTKNRLKIAAFFVFVVILSVITSFIPSDNSYLLSGILGTFGIVFIYRGSSRSRLLAYIPLIIFALAIISISLVDLIIFILRLTDFDTIDTLTGNLIIDLLLIIILCSVIFFKRRKQNKKQQESILSSGQYIFTLSGEIVSLLLCSFIQAIAKNGSNEKIITLLPMIGSMFAFLALLFLFACVRQQIATNRSMQLEREKDEYTLFVKLQSEHYLEILKKNEELHSFKHDCDSHLRALSGYLVNGETDEARIYLDKMLESLNAPQNKIYSGLVSLDSIIGDYEKYAEENNIAWQYMGRLPNLPANDCFALCTIFSNLMKNALEACQKVPSGSFIDTSVFTIGNYISITIRNSCLPDSSLSETSKSSPEEHGWGLKNVRRTVEHTHGSFKISIENSVCTAEVLYQL